MRKILFMLALLILISANIVYADGTGSSGDKVYWANISTDTKSGVFDWRGSSWVTVGVSTWSVFTIDFDRTANEIYIVNYTTAPAYVNWVSTEAATTNFLLQGYLEAIMGQQDFENVIRGTSRTEQIQSSHFSVLQDSGTVNIRIQWKTW